MAQKQTFDEDDFGGHEVHERNRRRIIIAELIRHACMSLVWGLFAFGWTDEPASLRVSNKDDWVKSFPFFEESGQATSDVGMRFHVFFTIQFTLSVVLLSCYFFAALVSLVPGLRLTLAVLRGIVSIKWVVSFLMYLSWAVVIISRFQPSGKIATGDGLDSGVDKSKLVFYEGLMIWWSVVIVGFYWIFNHVAQ